MKQESELLWEAYINSMSENTQPEQQLIHEKSNKKPDKDGDGVPTWADLDDDDPDVGSAEQEQDKKEKDKAKSKTVKEDISVHHDRFGFGIVVSENMNEDGNIGWYDVQFEHGREIINAVDLKLI